MSFIKKALQASPAYQVAKLSTKAIQQHTEEKQQTKSEVVDDSKPTENKSGFMKNFQEKQKEMQQKNQERIAEAKERREAGIQQVQAMKANIPLKLRVEYLGGYKIYSKKMSGQLQICADRIEFIGSFVYKFEIGKSEMSEITVDGQDTVIQQRTITRNVLLAGKSKKQEIKQTYITVSTKDGQTAVFHMPGKSHMEIRPQVLQKINLAGASQAGSIADELSKLADLKNKGILTQAEFDAKKQQFLN